MPGEPDKQGRDDRRTEDDSQRGPRQFLACRESRELAHHEFKVAFDRGEVRSCLINLSQRERVLVWHAPVLHERD